MTIGHIDFDENKPYGRILSRALTNLESGRDDLNNLVGVMTQMIDGDGSLASQFDYLIPKFGFEDNVHAKACYDELNSMLGKLNTDADVTGVHAAMNQVFNKLG